MSNRFTAVFSSGIILKNLADFIKKSNYNNCLIFSFEEGIGFFANDQGVAISCFFPDEELLEYRQTGCSKLKISCSHLDEKLKLTTKKSSIRLSYSEPDEFMNVEIMTMKPFETSSDGSVKIHVESNANFVFPQKILTSVLPQKFLRSTVSVFSGSVSALNKLKNNFLTIDDQGLLYGYSERQEFWKRMSLVDTETDNSSTPPSESESIRLSSHAIEVISKMPTITGDSAIKPIVNFIRVDDYLILEFQAGYSGNCLFYIGI